MAHLTNDQRAEYLTSVGPGMPITARGVTFTADLLSDLREAFRGDDGRPHFGQADFDNAVFTQDADFNGAIFEDDADFNGAIFHGDAQFSVVEFHKSAGFENATFAKFASFSGTVVVVDAFFPGATFSGDVWLKCAAKTITLSDSVVAGEMEVEATTEQFDATDMRVGGRVSLRLRGAQVDLTNAIIAAPLSLQGLRTPRPGLNRITFGNDTGPDVDYLVAITSLRGVDADRILLVDVDLSQCLFAGMHCLDQLRLEGQCTFATDPRGTRRILIEEKNWRVRRSTDNAAARSDTPDELEADTIGPARLEALYRQLRGTLEGSKNEPGAADFYYGEMEMRRHARRQDARRARRQHEYGRCLTNVTEFAILTLYWLVSGYALRAWRALAALLLMILLAAAGFAFWGFATPELPSRVVRIDSAGTLVYAPQSQTRPSGLDEVPNAIWFTAESATALLRGPDQPLTTTGRGIHMAVRLLGPTLLGLVIFSVRARVKR